MTSPTNRRAFLRRAGTAVVGGMLAGSLPHSSAMVQQTAVGEEDEAGKNRYIDAHVHVWTDDLTRYPLATGYRRESMKPPSFTPENLFSHCRPAGVSRIVLIQMSYYGFDNSYMLDVIATHPAVFAGVAVIDANHRNVAATMKSLRERRVTGFRLHPNESDPAFYEKWLRSDGIQTMFRQGAENGQAMCFLVNPNALPQIDQICERFPETDVVIDHMARIGANGRVAQRDVDNLVKCARHKRTFVKVSAFYALGKKQPPYTDLGKVIRQLRDAYGAQRLMWASDCPFQLNPGHTYQDSIDLIESRLDFLSEQDRNWLLRESAKRLYFG